MAYTANQLITRAYYLSQVISRDLQSVSGTEIEDGLYLLNALIDFKNTDTRLIPYYVRYDFETVAGQEMYFIPNLLMVDNLTFNIGPVRFSMTEFTRSQYFAISRVDGIESLPFSYRVERVYGGCNIYMYFVPSQVWEAKLSGKFSLTDVTLYTDMSLTYDTYYLEYLRYALAEYICCEYGSTFPDQSQAKLNQMVKQLTAVNPPDLSIQGDNYFGTGMGMDWQVANLTTGYWPF